MAIQGPFVEFKSQVTHVDKTPEVVEKIRKAIALGLAEMAEEGDAAATALAPAGRKPDKRSLPLKLSGWHESTATIARWGNRARHALPIELGGKPHAITGDVSFYWEREGRWWKRGSNDIKHPGNDSQAFLEPSAKMIFPRFNEFVKRHL